MRRARHQDEATDSSGLMNRRTMLKGMAATAGALTLPAALAACGSSSKGSTGGGGGGGGGGSQSVSFGSNYSDPAPKEAFAALVSAAEKSTDVKINVNTVDHDTFQNDITSYLQGTPNDLFTWFCGYRMQGFAQEGLIEKIDNVWDKIGPNFSDSVKTACKGTDGSYYIVPIYNYPWVVFYNKSTFSKYGYTIPTTWDAMIALCKKMKSDGLIPFAMGQKDGWPALGTFDIIDLRINGYDFHMDLMKHKVPWTDKRVTAVFDQWRQIVPYTQTGGPGRDWEDATKTLEQKKAGMLFQGTNQVAAQYVSDKADLDDLDFFVYPEIDPQWGQDYMDAPMDGFCISSKSSKVDAASKVLEYIGTGEAEIHYLKYDQWDVAVAQGVKVPTYNAIQKKSVEVISQAKKLTQFMDRDSNADFADDIVSQAVDQFLTSPTASTISSIQSSLEAQAKHIFASS